LLQLTGTDETCATFVFTDEDHTLGNSLRYVLSRNPDVSFVGYSIPHPSEPKLNMRLQTRKGPAIDMLRWGLKTLSEMCDHISEQAYAVLVDHAPA